MWCEDQVFHSVCSVPTAGGKVEFGVLTAQSSKVSEVRVRHDVPLAVEVINTGFHIAYDFVGSMVFVFYFHF